MSEIEEPSTQNLDSPLDPELVASEDIEEALSDTSGNGSNDDLPPESGLPPGGGSSGGMNRISLSTEVEQSYMGYAMSVIIGRALPDIRDGLKPVHRRCLFAMQQMGNRYNRATIKSARVAGEVNGKFHPHGDQTIYETIVRMAQHFLMRYPLVEGQGNFGSVDGDPPAAPRYTEMRLERITEELLADLDRETVDFIPNYDETLTMPEVLPTRIPNLLINGSDGIAVAMATKMPPHNIGEVLNACIAVVENPDATIDDLLEHVKGPDFPTAGIINGRAGIIAAYRTGRGRISLRSRAEIIEGDVRDSIVVTEIPYQVNKSVLIERIAELVKEKRIEGITEIRDESDKDGLRIVIELRRGEIAQTILNKLFKHTALETSYAINNTALVRGAPRQVNLRDLIDSFLEHRREVIARRTQYLLRQNRTQGHVLEGQSVALANIDEVVELIKQASNREEAHVALLGRTWEAANIEALLSRADRDIVRPLDLEAEYGFQSSEDDTTSGQYALSPRQASAILDMRLHRLTGLEQQSLIDDYKKIVSEIRDLMEIQGSEERVSEVIIEELTEVRDTFQDERRTEIRDSEADLTDKELIKPEQVVVTLSHEGYAKAMPVAEYNVQGRGGKGIIGVKVRQDDFTEQVVVTHNHNMLLMFTNQGRVFGLDAFKVPQASRTARGYPIVNLLRLNDDEKVSCIFSVPELDDPGYLLFATKKGIVKRSKFSDFSRIRGSGLKAIRLDDDDQLLSVERTSGHDLICLAKSSGLMSYFKESDIRVMGRTARGVFGTRLRGEDRVVGLIVGDENVLLCTVSEHGIGKRVSLDEFNTKRRGGIGVRLANVSERTGKLVSALRVSDGDDLILVNQGGKFIRINVDTISVLGRTASGVKLMNASSEDPIIEVDRVPNLAQVDADSADNPSTDADEDEAGE